MLHVVLRRAGKGWLPGVALRRQSAWEEHARFMDDLAAQGLGVLGGPIDDVGGTLLVLESDSAAGIRSILAGDVWSAGHVLRLDAVYGWKVALGAPSPAQVRRIGGGPYVAVLYEQAAARRAGVCMRGQPLWQEHADFMDALDGRGLIAIGGPLTCPDGIHRALVVMVAGPGADVRALLDPDPWLASAQLHIAWIRPWHLLLGGAGA